MLLAFINHDMLYKRVNSWTFIVKSQCNVVKDNLLNLAFGMR
jgi:hypothetical protein